MLISLCSPILIWYEQCKQMMSAKGAESKSYIGASVFAPLYTFYTQLSLQQCAVDNITFSSTH